MQEYITAGIYMPSSRSKEGTDAVFACNGDTYTGHKYPQAKEDSGIFMLSWEINRVIEGSRSHERLVTANLSVKMTSLRNPKL